MPTAAAKPAGIDASVADGLQSYLAQRRDARARTYAAIAELAKRCVSAILRADIKQLMATMQADVLSASTIQKEVAMLKLLFNTMLNDGYWVGFANPCDKIPLGKSCRIPRRSDRTARPDGSHRLTLSTAI